MVKPIQLSPGSYMPSFHGNVQAEISSQRSSVKFEAQEIDYMNRISLPLFRQLGCVVRGLRTYRKSGVLIRLALVFISGVALALAFPKVGVSVIAWIALVPLLFAIERQPLYRVAFYAWAQGFIFYVLVLYWIEIDFHNYVHWSVVASLGPLLCWPPLRLSSTRQPCFSLNSFVEARKSPS